MAEKIRRVTYCYVDVPDMPGEGARVLTALAQQGVSLMAITAFPKSAGWSQVDLVAGSGDLDAAASKAGVTLGPKKQAFYISGEDRPGAAADVLRRLAEAKINVTAMNACCGQSGFGMILWVKQADIEAAAKALGAT